MAIIKDKNYSRMDYVSLYACALRDDASHFAQHKKLIDSQIKSSRELFHNKFAGKDFYVEARKYLKARGVI